MKKLFLISAILGSGICYAAEELPTAFPEDLHYVLSTHRNINPETCPEGFDMEEAYRFEGTTMVDGVEAFELWNVTPRSYTKKEFVGYFRNDGSKAYYWFDGSASHPKGWYLIYDFGVQKGETVEVYSFEKNEPVKYILEGCGIYEPDMSYRFPCPMIELKVLETESREDHPNYLYWRSGVGYEHGLIPDYSEPQDKWISFSDYAHLYYNGQDHELNRELRDYENYFVNGTCWEVEYDIPNNPVTLIYTLRQDDVYSTPKLICYDASSPSESVTLGKLSYYLSNINLSYPNDGLAKDGGLLYYFRSRYSAGSSLLGGIRKNHIRYTINPLDISQGIGQKEMEVRIVPEEEETPDMPENYTLNVFYNFPDVQRESDKWIKGIGSIHGFFQAVIDGQKYPSTLKRVYNSEGDIYVAQGAGVETTETCQSLNIRSYGKSIHVTDGTPGEEIAIYNLSGMKVASSLSGELTAAALPSGIYIVHHDGKTRKLTVK